MFLLTSLSLKDNAEWPRDSLDDIFYMPDENKQWNRDQTLLAVSYLARSLAFNRIVALDDFDLEIAAALREHLRVPGMGETTTRYFRDKLAMRMRGREAGLRVPPFVHLLNDSGVRRFTEDVAPPWMLKPRSQAGSTGITKVQSYQELLELDRNLGDRRSFFLLEKFVPGDVFHVDSIVSGTEVLFATASRYGTPPMEVSHGGGIFTSQLLERGSAVEQALLEANSRVLPALGLLQGVSHTEFIRSQDGEIYFLETSARVGGAHLADLVEAGTGINLWAEWAKLEVAGPDYRLPPAKTDYAGLVVSLARQEWPDTSAYTDPEIVWRMHRRHHVGMIVASPDRARTAELLSTLIERVRRDFHASVPPKDRPSA